MRTFVECRKISDDAELRRHEWQEVGNAADGLATAIQTGDTVKQAKESARLDAALAAVPAPRYVTTSAEDLEIPLLEAEERNTKRRGPGYVALRVAMPILRHALGRPEPQ